MHIIPQILVAVTLIVSCQDTLSLTGKNGSMSKFAIKNGYLYTVTFDQLKTIDIANLDDIHSRFMKKWALQPSQREL